jgi:hypothetical protein
MYFLLQNANAPITPTREIPTGISKKQATMVRHRELFQGQNDMLSNLAPATVFYRDMKFDSVEQAYQFLKCIECGYIIKATQVLATVSGPQAKATTRDLIVSRKCIPVNVE